MMTHDNTDERAWAELPARWRDELKIAMKARDRVSMSVLRTLLAAVANAEAVPVDTSGARTSGAWKPSADPEVPRRALRGGDVERVVRAELADRHDTLAQYEAAGRPDAAAALRVEIDILLGYVPEVSDLRS